MKSVVTFNYAAFNQELNRRLVQWGEAVGVALKQEGKLLVRNCAGFTPPTTNAPKVDVANWSKQRRAGEAAIQRDIENVFLPVTKIADRFNDKKLASRIAKYAEAGEDEKIKAVFKDLKIKGQLIKDASPDVHKSSRGSNGRTLRRTYIVQAERSIKALIGILKRRVGFAKAGWKPAARGLGVTLPAWINRHSAPGAISIRLNTAQPSITIENAVAYAQKHNQTANVIQRALNLSAENLTKRLNATMNRTFRK
jgi:hypothetical protein